jgi:hypothetical protein
MTLSSSCLFFTTVQRPELSVPGGEPPETEMGGFKVEKCDECHRLEALLQESNLDYLAAANRYNTWRLTGLDTTWAWEVLRTAEIVNAERQRQLDQHAGNHARPALRMAAGAYSAG